MTTDHWGNGEVGPISAKLQKTLYFDIVKGKVPEYKKWCMPIYDCFFGLCVKNLILSIKYLFSKQVRFSSVISQAAAISYDSLTISLVIVLIAASVIAIQVSKQFLMSGADSYIGGTMAIVS